MKVKGFQEVLDDPTVGPRSGKKISRVLLCTGKIYYDLMAKKAADNRKDIAIVRVEQLYPLPQKQLEAIFKKYSHADVWWVQEEPSNMGAWQYMNAIFLYSEFNFDKKLTLVSRKSSASPATGFKKVHDEQQKEIVEKAFS